MEYKYKEITELKDQLKKQIINKQGIITIDIDNISHISKSNDIIGKAIEEWLPTLVRRNKFNLIKNKHSQAFPDFIMKSGNREISMDMKCWNYNRSPGFDIANFDSFYKTVYNNPDKIFAQYLIAGYEPNEEGFKIKYLSVKNLWEITGPAKYPIKMQKKQNRPYAIRPINMANKDSKSFKGPKELIKGVRDTRKMFPLPKKSNINYSSNEWYRKVEKEIENKEKNI